jgi:hypothetical protein
MRFKSHQGKVQVKLGNRICVLGNIIKEHILPPDFNDALCSTTSVNANYFFFFRLKKHGYYFVAEDYGKGSRNSSCVKFKSSSDEIGFGLVKIFVKVTGCNCDVLCNHDGTYNALVHKFKCSIPFRTTHLLLCEMTNDIQLIPIENLECVCFKICLDEELFYLSVPLNCYELE